MKPLQSLITALTVALAVLSLGACERRTDTPKPSTAVSGSDSGTALPQARLADAQGTGAPGTSTAGSPAPSTAPTGAVGSTASSGAAPTSTSSGAAAVTGTAGGLAPSSQIAANNAAQPESPLSLADQNFVTTAAAGGLYEVEAARAATGRASNPAVKAFAQMLLQHHTVSNDQLKQLAARKRISIPTELPAGKRPTLEKLVNAPGAQFDQQFVETVGVADHKDNIALFERAAAEVKDADVRNFAQQTLPVLREHLAAAQKLPVSSAPTSGR